MDAAVRHRRALLAVFVWTLISACSSTSIDGSAQRAAEVYEQVVRWFVQEVADDPDPLPVFVEPRGEGASIDLVVQTAVISSTSDVASVRFIDTTEEALVTRSDGKEVVVDGGMLLHLEPVVEDGDRVRLEVEVRRGEGPFEVLEFDLRYVEGGWSVESPPVEIPLD